MLNSPLKPLHEYGCTLSLKLSQFCCLGSHYFGKDPWCSPFLLATGHKSILFLIFGLVVSLVIHHEVNPVYWVTGLPDES